MINITDTEIRTMELEKLLDKIDTKADLEMAFLVKEAYNKGLERADTEYRCTIEDEVIDGLECVQANMLVLKSYVSDTEVAPSEKAINYVLLGAIEQLEKIMRVFGYKGVND